MKLSIFLSFFILLFACPIFAAESPWKLDGEKLLTREPAGVIPGSGETPLDLLPQNTGDFSKSLVFKGDQDFAPQRGSTLRFWVDEGNQYQDKPTWRFVSLDRLTFNLMPVEPSKVTPGKRVFVSLRIFAERGRPILNIMPWQGGMMGTTPFATGTFRPEPGEEDRNWCCIHAYLTIPENVQGLMPVISSGSVGAVYNIAEWTISRPSEDEFKPQSKKVTGFAKERIEEKT